jgi:parallel beta-helix repeat protein
MLFGIAMAFLALVPGAASAQPVTCGQTITRDTTLHADLGPCPGDGLVIGADNVTLNLNDHKIVGNAAGEDVGVLDDGHGGVVVENGRIRGFFVSIKLDAADGSRVSHMTETETSCCHLHFVEVLDSSGSQIENNISFATGDQTVFVVSGSNNSVENNVAARGSESDIVSFSVSGSQNNIRENVDRHEGGGMRIIGSRNRITHNKVDEGERPPLGAVDVEGARNLVAANTMGDIDNGTSVVGTGNVIRNNVVGIGPNASITGGLIVGDCRNVRVEGNVVYNPVQLSGCDGARMEDNRVAGGPIMVRVGSGNLIQNNDVSDTESYGIIVSGGSDNSVEQNTVSETELTGILVGPFSGAGHSVGTTVKGNLATRAGDDGIHVDDPGTLIADNTANDNADLGIEAVPGVIDGGGNTASGNGNPLQCLNVVCS